MKHFNCVISGGSTVIVNGKTYKGNNLSIIDGKVFVDGEEQSGEDTKHFEIKIIGKVENVNVAHGNLSIEGDVTGKVDCDGSTSIIGRSRAT